jgi:hypothetical protein
MAFPFAFICFVDLLLGWLSLPFDYAKTFNYNELIIVEICSGSSSYKLGWFNRLYAVAKLMKVVTKIVTVVYLYVQEYYYIIVMTCNIIV